MSTLTEVRDAIQGIVNTGWLASLVTQSLPLVFDDVDGEKPGLDANGQPQAYGRSTVRHLTSEPETFGGDTKGKDLNVCQVVVQVFAPKGRGYTQGDAIAQVVKGFFQRVRVVGIDGWFTSVTVNEVAARGPWDQINVVAEFRYAERVG